MFGVHVCDLCALGWSRYAEDYAMLRSDAGARLLAAQDARVHIAPAAAQRAATS